jgi:hypothetical protein
MWTHVLLEASDSCSCCCSSRTTTTNMLPFFLADASSSRRDKLSGSFLACGADSPRAILVIRKSSSMTESIVFIFFQWPCLCPPSRTMLETKRFGSLENPCSLQWVGPMHLKHLQTVISEVCFQPESSLLVWRMFRHNSALQLYAGFHQTETERRYLRTLTGPL